MLNDSEQHYYSGSDIEKNSFLLQFWGLYLDSTSFKQA